MILEGFELYSPHGDTILIAEKLNASVDLNQYWDDKKIVINKLTLENTTAYYQAYKDSSNIQFLLQYFTPPKKKEKKVSKNLNFDLKQLELINNQFRYLDHTKKHYAKVVDFGDLDIKQLNADFRNIKLTDKSIQVDIKQLNLREKKGLEVKGLVAKAFVSNKRIQLDKLLLITNKSTIKDFVKLEFNSFDDFSDFNNRVNVSLRIKNSILNSEDIAFFSSSMHRVKFDLKIKQATAQGRVNHIDAKNIQIETEKATKLKGNVKIIGLPDIDQTDFKLTDLSLQSTYADLQVILPKLSNNKNFKLPEIVKILNTVSYQGDLHGLYNNFHIDGELKTELGALSTKSSLNFQNETQFSGLYESKSFDIGRFLNNSLLKTTGFNLNLKGKGSSSKTLSIDLDGNLENFNFRNYTYQQIPISGIIAEEKFKGSGSIKDPNASIDFQADVDWSDTSVLYNLVAGIHETNLYALHLSQQDSIIVHNTTIETNLKGSNINNLVGDLKANNINFSTKKGTFDIKEVVFQASGDEINRLLTVSSDVVVASLIGQIDLKTIVPYFKMLAMRYAPAIGFETELYNNQNLNWTFKSNHLNPSRPSLKRKSASIAEQLCTLNFQARKTLHNSIYIVPFSNIVA
ncbi:hypothetical protein [Sphingobacterium sp. IITKGP-BTPF85]|uniref:hypothetical protein n=1 Tax=Sphingobacterium sp. IITKGP-BTPF85 TaxID=1338009 RepID=UPI00038A3AAB|nr:hypothetical protein [Sphingobacterium sp. IITKGP-BTPF85]